MNTKENMQKFAIFFVKYTPIAPNNKYGNSDYFHFEFSAKLQHKFRNTVIDDDVNFW